MLGLANRRRQLRHVGDRFTNGAAIVDCKDEAIYPPCVVVANNNDRAASRLKRSWENFNPQPEETVLKLGREISG